MNPWLDISVPVYSGMVNWPSDPPVKISRHKDMNLGAGNNLSVLSMSAHTGTHMDAPLHFIKDGEGIDTVPLDAVMGPCRVIEIKAQDAVWPDDLRPYRIRKGERILLKTRNSTRSWKTEQFDTQFVYIPKETSQYLVDRGVRTLGVDYLSVGGYKKDGSETHRILLGARIWIIEGLNLAKIKPGRYDLLCLPLKLRGLDGAPARALLRLRE
jgi:arylformamidase